MSWSTTDEIRFINGLGQHRNPSAVISFEEKLEHLIRYLEGMEHRVVWGSINSNEVRAYALSRIEYYQKLIARQPKTQQSKI